MKAEKNEQILDAALEEFLTKGVAAASMQRIAQEAQVSKRTLYKYYSSKEELFGELLDVILCEMESIYQFDLSKFNSQDDVVEVISNFLDQKMAITFNESFLRINRMAIGEILRGTQIPKEQMDRINKSEMLFLEWIKGAQKKGVIRGDLEATQIAGDFNSLLKGQIYWPVLLGMVEASEIKKAQVKGHILDIFSEYYLT